MRSSRRSVLRIFAALMAAIVVLIGAERWAAENRPFAERRIAELKPIQEKQLELFVQQSNLLTTLTTGVLAALGALVLKLEKESRASGQWSLLGTAILAGFSLYFGYFAYDEVIWMLGVGFFNLDSPPVIWPRRAQFFSFLGSVCCGLYFVLTHVYNRESPTGLAHAPE